jgi:two-component system cell cycle response regulator
MKILIADKAQDAREILGTILEEQEYQCFFADKECDLIDKVYQELPDIIILDDRNGKHACFDIVRKLKSAPSTRDIPVIISSSRRSPLALAKGYQLGAYDYIYRPYFREEILARISNIIDSCQRMKTLGDKLDRDYLTGLYNRKFFMDRFAEEIAWSMNYKEPLSIMLLDVDHFKKVNDTYGHSCGDEVLRQVAQTAASVARPEHVAARYGGEEFILLMPNLPRHEAAGIAEEMRRSVQDHEFTCDDRGNPVHLSATISIGVSTLDPGGESTLDRMIDQVDKALYAAKEAGRNRVHVHPGKSFDEGKREGWEPLDINERSC